MRDIGKNIRLIRTKKKLTQDELAERLFVSRQTVSNYETGRSRPDIDMLIRVSEILEVDIQDLLYGPSDDRTQEAEKCRLLIVCGVLAGTALLCEIVEYFCAASYPELWYFRQGASYSLWLLLRPCLFLLIGWTVMQGLSLLPKVRIVPYCMKTGYRIIAAILAAYFLIHIIFCGGLLYIEWRQWQHALRGAEEAFQMGFSVPVVLQCARFFANHHRNLWGFFIPLGMLLWLTSGKPGREDPSLKAIEEESRP